MIPSRYFRITRMMPVGYGFGMFGGAVCSVTSTCHRVVIMRGGNMPDTNQKA